MTLAVNGLRGMPKESNRYYMDNTELLSPIHSARPSSGDYSVRGGSGGGGDRIEKEAVTMRRLRDALDKSDDEGDTLDLSRRHIEVIGEEAVGMFRNGVGKDRKGVWR